MAVKVPLRWCRDWTSGGKVPKAASIAAHASVLDDVPDWLVAGHTAFRGLDELSAGSLRNFLQPAALPANAAAGTLRKPGSDVATDLAHYVKVVDVCHEYATAMLQDAGMDAADLDVLGPVSQTEHALQLMDLQRYFRATHERGPIIATSPAVKSKLEASGVTVHLSSFQYMYRQDMDLSRVPDLNVLRALTTSLDETNGTWPVAGKNMDFRRMGASYNAAAPPRQTISLGGTVVATEDSEAGPVGSNRLLFINAFVRKMHGVLLLLHGAQVDARRDGGGFGSLPGVEGEFHLTFTTVQRWATFLGGLVHSPMTIQQIDSALSTMEAELFRMTSEPRRYTIGHALEAYYSPFAASVRKWRGALSGAF